MFKRKDRPKREFRPQSHAAVYLVALVYLGYLLVQMIAGAWKGGADAPTAAQLAAGVLILGGGMVVLAVLAWRMYRLKPTQPREDAGEADPAAPPAEDGPDETEDGAGMGE